MIVVIAYSGAPGKFVHLLPLCILQRPKLQMWDILKSFWMLALRGICVWFEFTKHSWNSCWQKWVQKWVQGCSIFTGDDNGSWVQNERVVTEMEGDREASRGISQHRTQNNLAITGLTCILFQTVKTCHALKRHKAPMTKVREHCMCA